MKKKIYKLKGEHRTWTLEVFETDTAVHIYASAKGEWTPEGEVQYTEWIGTLDLPWATKDIITTMPGGETVTHHPNGMIVRERPGLPTEITIAEPPTKNENRNT